MLPALCMQKGTAFRRCLALCLLCLYGALAGGGAGNAAALYVCA